MIMGLPDLRRQNKSEKPGTADQASRLIIEWTTNL
jgi:hypothetical protein